MDCDSSGFNKEELIKLVQEQARQINDQNETIGNQNTTIDDLSTQVKLLERYIFARKNEKWTSEDKTQGRLFDEIEANAPENDSDDDTPADKKRPTSTGNTGKKPLPKDLPRVEEPYDIEGEEKLCPCCHKERPLIGKEISEELDFIPAKIRVRRIRVKRYGACDCTEFQENEELPQVVTAKAPERFMPGSIASPGLVAHIITNKFCDALPFYRQERIFRRIGVDISRQNMCNWSMKASRKCSGIMDHLKKIMLQGILINMDETRLQVLNEINRDAKNGSFMWVMAGGDERKVVLFNYSPTRNQEIPLALLEGFSGILQTDGYAAYNRAVSEYGLVHVGCLTHVRRKFHNLAEATKRKGKAHQGLEYCNRIYGVEKQLRDQNLPPDDFLEERKRLAIPIWDEFYQWLTEMIRKNVSGPLGEAVNYAFNQYPNLIRYLNHPAVTPDNNKAENAIRPFVIGRKNWLFNNTPNGAHASAVLYSLIETAKANKVEPVEYLNYLFSRLPETGSSCDWEEFMPWNMEK